MATKSSHGLIMGEMVSPPFLIHFCQTCRYPRQAKNLRWVQILAGLDCSLQCSHFGVICPWLLKKAIDDIVQGIVLVSLWNMQITWALSRHEISHVFIIWPEWTIYFGVTYFDCWNNHIWLSGHVGLRWAKVALWVTCFFHSFMIGDWLWSNFNGHSLNSADSRMSVAGTSPCSSVSRVSAPGNGRSRVPSRAATYRSH